MVLLFNLKITLGFNGFEVDFTVNYERVKESFFIAAFSWDEHHCSPTTPELNQLVEGAASRAAGGRDFDERMWNREE